MKTGVDSVAMTASEWTGLLAGVPAPDVIGCYGNGSFANHTAAKEASPHAVILVYDVSGSLPEADALDIEPRDATPNDAHGWAIRHNALKVKRTFRYPFLYASASTVSQVISDMLDGGFKRTEFFIQSAHYTPAAHICGPGQCQYPQADSTQWHDTGPRGQNIDQTLYQDHCFPPSKPADPDANYGRFDATKRTIFARRSERQIVQEYDRWRATQTKAKHPHRARLAVLRVQLRLAATRLTRLKHPEKFDRAWRLRELKDRAAGRRLV